jgi:hypothetical protein
MYFHVGIIKKTRLFINVHLIPISKPTFQYGNLQPAEYFLIEFVDTVKPAHAYTFIKQPPVLKGHFFLVIEYFV